MDNWEIFNETLLPNKKAFYSNLNMEDITDTDFMHANKVFKEFKLKTWENIMICMPKVIHYYLQMSLKILEMSVLRYMN